MAYPQLPGYKELKRELKLNGLSGVFRLGQQYEDAVAAAIRNEVLVKKRLAEAEHQEKVKTATLEVTEALAEANQKLKES